MSTMTRRGFLKLVSVSAAAVASACRAANDASTPPVQTGSTTPAPGVEEATPASGVAEATPAADGLPAAPKEIVIYAQDELYRQSYDGTPGVNPADWSLTIDGLVEHPMTLTYDEVRALPKVEEVRTLECIGNPVGGNLVGNVRWGGFYLKDLLDRAVVKPSAIRAKFTAADDYQTAVNLEWILQPNTLMAYEINGEPLQPEHGFPLRILMPGLYGQKMPKWIKRIEFVDEKFQGYWERQGWSDVASVKTNSIIQQPKSLDKLPTGALPLYGVAFAGLRKITLVEVQIDGGEWRAASLVQADTSLVWTQWSFEWPAEPGRHTLTVRATDQDGFVQTDKKSGIFGDAFPDGTDKIHEIVFNVA